MTPEEIELLVNENEAAKDLLERHNILIEDLMTRIKLKDQALNEFFGMVIDQGYAHILRKGSS